MGTPEVKRLDALVQSMNTPLLGPNFIHQASGTMSTSDLEKTLSTINIEKNKSKAISLSRDSLANSATDSPMQLKSIRKPIDIPPVLFKQICAS